MSTTIIEIDAKRYAIPVSESGDPTSRFALPDGRIVRVTAWAETFPAQVARFEIDSALPCAVPLASGGGQ